MAYGQPSGATAYSPFISDIVLDAYERCGIYDLNGKHMQSARRSANLILTSDFSNRGINLWKLQEVVIPAYQGVITYNLTRDVAAVYDVYRRQYQMNPAQNYAVAFTTVLGSPNVTISLPGTSVPAGGYIGLQIPVSVGGIVLNGFYQVTSTPTATSVTVVAISSATSSVTAGGAVPVFTTTASSANVTVTLANHGLLPGQPFNIAVETSVGGIQLQGSYSVLSVTDANNFVIAATATALSGQTVAENGGEAFIATQNTTAPYADLLMGPISRTDYAGQANKTAQGTPTTIWVNMQTIPQYSLWPAPDQYGPYEIHLWCMKQIDDANPTGGQTLDVPPRFYMAFTADLARDLSLKFAPDKYAMLKTEADAAWARAEATDSENVSLFLVPQISTGLG